MQLLSKAKKRRRIYNIERGVLILFNKKMQIYHEKNLIRPV